MQNPVHPRLLFCLFAAAWLIINTAGATTITGGNVINQTWTPAGSPYIVQGDVTVPAGAFLNINAGTVVQFASTDGQAAGQDVSRVELIVRGTLAIAGTAASPVSLQAQSGSGLATWYGIEATATAASVTIDHAQVQNAAWGIQNSAPGTVLSVTNTTIDTSGEGVNSSDGSPSFDAVQVSGCSDGFYFSGKGTPTLTNVISRSNAGSGVFAEAVTGALTVTIINATIDGNADTGITVTSSSAFLSLVTARNLIVTNNSIAGIARDPDGGPNSVGVTYSDVWHSGVNYAGGAAAGIGCISSNPNYIAPTNFHVNAGSPVIDSGNGAPGSPTHDYDGVARPLDGDGVGGAAWDMGAYEFVPASPVLGSVPETSGGPQPPLAIGTPDHGATLNLQWGAACGGATNDYAVYEGTLGTWYSHVPGLCTTSGNLSASYPPGSGNRYYLVVPLSATSEGIYGHASGGGPIPPSSSACRAIPNSTACP
jgi:hypothetical protein